MRLGSNAASLACLSMPCGKVYVFCIWPVLTTPSLDTKSPRKMRNKGEEPTDCDPTLPIGQGLKSICFMEGIEKATELLRQRMKITSPSIGPELVFPSNKKQLAVPGCGYRRCLIGFRRASLGRGTRKRPCQKRAAGESLDQVPYPHQNAANAL